MRDSSNRLQKFLVWGCAASAMVGFYQSAKASTYLIDATYAGTEGAPYTSPGGTSYAAAYNTITDALGSTASHRELRRVTQISFLSLTGPTIPRAPLVFRFPTAKTTLL